jgi:hypothetical protein
MGDCTTEFVFRVGERQEQGGSEGKEPLPHGSLCEHDRDREIIAIIGNTNWDKQQQKNQWVQSIMQMTVIGGTDCKIWC